MEEPVEYKEEYDAVVSCDHCGKSLGRAANYWGESWHICDKCYSKLPSRTKSSIGVQN